MAGTLASRANENGQSRFDKDESMLEPSDCVSPRRCQSGKKTKREPKPKRPATKLRQEERSRWSPPRENARPDGFEQVTHSPLFAIGKI